MKSLPGLPFLIAQAVAYDLDTGKEIIRFAQDDCFCVKELTSRINAPAINPTSR